MTWMGDLNAVVATVETAELLLRVAAVVLTGAASVYVFAKLRDRTVHPRSIWQYVGLMSFLTFIWRVIVLAMAFSPDLYEMLRVWVTPVTAAVYCAGAISLLLLTYCASRIGPGHG